MGYIQKGRFLRSYNKSYFYFRVILILFKEEIPQDFFIFYPNGKDLKKKKKQQGRKTCLGLCFCLNNERNFATEKKNKNDAVLVKELGKNGNDALRLTYTIQPITVYSCVFKISFVFITRYSTWQCFFPKGLVLTGEKPYPLEIFLILKLEWIFNH